MPADLIAQLEAEARARFVRWDPALWKALVEGPAEKLAVSLQAGGSLPDRTGKLIESYLRLACEGIGLGYLFPPSAGTNFFTVAWQELIPAKLGQVPIERQAQVLADCFNLGENLEGSPLWLRRMFLRLLPGLRRLDELPALAAKVQRDALAEPVRKLGGAPRIEWVHLADEVSRFLPGELHFLAPAIVCVHERRETKSEASAPEAADTDPSVLVWLTDPPMTLGAMGCTEQPQATSDRMDLVLDLARRDARAGDVLNSVANEWRAAVTLETSQFLVALLP